MKRLTEAGYTYHSCDFMEDGVYELANRLAEYEDTGLTPEQIRKLKERRKVERRNSIFVRHISSNGHSWSKSIWIKRDAETWQTEKGE